jgi:hypothetical protein
MSEWISRVKDHRIWKMMKDLGPTIDRAARLDDLDPAAAEALERLTSVLAFCGKRLGGSDPLTVLPTTLDAMAGAFETEKSEIDLFIADRNLEHLTTANSAADSTLTNLVQVPGVSGSEELIGLMQAVASYRTALEEQERSASAARKSSTAEVAELTTALDAFKSQTQATITELKSQLDGERQKISTTAAEQQKLFADSQAAHNSTYNDTLLKIQENLAKTLSDQQGQFSSAQENRSREFAAAQTDSQKRFGDLITDYARRLADQDAEFTKQRDVSVATAEKSLADLNRNFENEAKGILEEVNKRRKEVEKLVGVIGNLGVTSGYQTTANNARISMWVWQGVAVAAMAVVILFAFKAFLPTLQGNFNWEAFAARVVFLTITVGVLAAYAASQADRFFHMEKYNRKLALELAAIDPFIALLPQDEQQKFKLEIGRRSFAQEETVTPKDSRSPATTLDVLASKEGQQLVQVVVDAVQKAVSAK